MSGCKIGDYDPDMDGDENIAEDGICVICNHDADHCQCVDYDDYKDEEEPE